MTQRFALALVMLAAGCEGSGPEQATQAVATANVAPFDSKRAAAITGTVRWQGAAPALPRLEIVAAVSPTNPPHSRLVVEHPGAPRIDKVTGAVAGAVIFLRDVDPAKAAPWLHPPVTVEHKNRHLTVLQGDKPSAVGFVRLGDSITAVSREKVYNALHARGASFFTLPLPDADRPTVRPLDKRGVLHLSSGAGWYWMSAHLFVDDHPYYCQTGPDGTFTLPQVPPGTYRIVCWMPNWNVSRQEHDSETGIICRMLFHRPLEVEQYVEVPATGQGTVVFVLSETMFKR
jgi:hypothetical protein